MKEQAGLFSNYVRDEKETLLHFNKLCSDKDFKWNIKDLHSFCLTRRLGYNDKNSRQLPLSKLLSRIRTQLELEVNKGRAHCIYCPRKSQLPSRNRRTTLVREGILNVRNCRRLVNVEPPKVEDTRWR